VAGAGRALGPGGRSVRLLGLAADFEANSAYRETRVLQPIEIPEIAEELETTADMVFGRLHHDLDRRYGEPPAMPGRARKAFFTPRAGTQVHCVNWPLLVGILAGMWEERRRRYLTTGLSVASLIVAIVALGASIFV